MLKNCSEVEEMEKSRTPAATQGFELFARPICGR
jgi:hypothetical protein